MLDSLQHHGLHHTRFPCPSPSPRACSNSCQLSQRCHPSILSSVVPVSFCPQSFPESESFLMSWPFASGGQSIGVSASVVPVSSCLQSFPASGAFLMSWPFTSGFGVSEMLPKYWSFSFSISPSNEYSGLISFGMDWFDLLAVQGTLKSLQHHISKASFSAFFIVQLSHPYTCTLTAIAKGVARGSDNL